MIGGGVLAYTLLGVELRQDAPPRFLILDPHYPAAVSSLKTIKDKG
jgi:hypothetical protein